MTSTVTPEDVWKALLEDPYFKELSELNKKVLKPFVEALPSILADMLEDQVTLSNLSKAKVLYLRHSLDNGLIGVSVDVMPKKMISQMGGRRKVKKMFESLFGRLIEMYEPMVTNLTAVLAGYGVTEDQIMTNPKNGLSGRALKLYQEHGLTVADLLKLQPGVIINNSSK